MKYALVTGANRGLGYGFCQVLVTRGYKVFAATRDVSTFSFAHPQVVPVELHIENDDSIRKVCDMLAVDHVQLDLLINNAGVNRRSASVGGAERVSDLAAIDRRSLLHMFDVNSVSPLVLTRYCIPLMTADRCFVINVSSGRASFGNESNNANYGYRASKVALNMFTRASVYDLPKNVQTFAVHPGLVLTDMNPDGDTSPEVAAKRIMTITDSWDSTKNGAFLDSDGSLFPL